MAAKTNTVLRWGMIGGGDGSNIGDSHRMAARLDNKFDLCAGAFDINAQKGKDFGLTLGMEANRLYPDYQTLIEGEANRPDGVQIVSITTPNATHFEIAKACLGAGLHIILSLIHI